MLDSSLLKNGDTFYYLLKLYRTVKNKETCKYYVFAYQFHKEWDKCYDKNLMFLTEKEAKVMCRKLNQMV